MFIKPRTSCSRDSVASELMLQADTCDYVGEATWFIRHTWGSPSQTRWTPVCCFSRGARTLRLRKCGRRASGRAARDCRAEGAIELVHDHVQEQYQNRGGTTKRLR